MGTSNSIYHQSSGTEMAERQNRSSTLTHVTAAVAVPIPGSGDTVCVGGCVLSKHCVLEKHTEQWAAFYLH